MRCWSIEWYRMLRPSDRLRPQRGHAGVDGHVETPLSQIDLVPSPVSKTLRRRHRSHPGSRRPGVLLCLLTCDASLCCVDYTVQLLQGRSPTWWKQLCKRTHSSSRELNFFYLFFFCLFFFFAFIIFSRIELWADWTTQGDDRLSTVTVFTPPPPTVCQFRPGMGKLTFKFVISNKERNTAGLQRHIFIFHRH